MKQPDERRERVADFARVGGVVFVVIAVLNLLFRDDVRPAVLSLIVAALYFWFARWWTGRAAPPR